MEAVGFHLGVDMSKVWAPDESFFELLRDRQVLTAMVAELAGPEVASANANEKCKGLKAILRDCLSGENGRERVYGWVPRWMRLPPSAYTERGGVGTVRLHAEVAALLQSGASDSSGDDAPAHAEVAEEQAEPVLEAEAA